jgi:DNA-binding NarL/FixJ family response regulator
MYHQLPATLERMRGRTRLPFARCQLMDQTLTRREREVVVLVSYGLSNKEVAQRLKLTESTIKTHLHNIYRKLGIGKRTALVAATVGRH